MCGCLLRAAPPTPMRTWPATQAFALTGNLTGDPLVCRLVFSPLSHTSKGRRLDFKARHYYLCDSRKDHGQISYNLPPLL